MQKSELLLYIQVAVVQSVENHLNSEKLYVCKVDVDGDVVKQVQSLDIFTTVILVNCHYCFFN